MTRFCFLSVLLICFLFAPLSAQEKFDQPREVLEAYLKACEAGDYEAAKACYTASSRKRLAEQEGSSPTPEALQALHQRLSSVKFTEEKINENRAIFWAQPKDIPPFLLRIQDPKEGWRMDYHFMSNYIKINDDGWKWRNKRLFKIWKSRK